MIGSLIIALFIVIVVVSILNIPINDFTGLIMLIGIFILGIWIYEKLGRDGEKDTHSSHTDDIKSSGFSTHTTYNRESDKLSLDRDDEYYENELDADDVDVEQIDDIDLALEEYESEDGSEW